jgi:excisionase family DNA binding protein
MRVAKRPQPTIVRSDTPWVTVQQAADHLLVGVDAIYDACANKGMKHAKIGRSTIRLRLAWVDQWAEDIAAKTG